MSDLSQLHVYLAGGMRSGWQDQVIEVCPQFTYLDPRSHGLSDSREYTLWDTEAIRRCHVFLRYMEITNPGGPNCSLELGYAKALGKMIINVDEKQDKYDRMSWVLSDVTFLLFSDFLNWWASFPHRVNFEIEGPTSGPIIISTQN